MQRLRHILFRSWYVLDSLEDRIYHIILDVAVFVSVATVATGLLIHSPQRTVMSSVMTLLYLIVLQTITMRFPQYSRKCRMALVLGFNLVFLPLTFFASGGIYGGGVLFLLLGMTMCAVLLRGNISGILFLVSTIAMELAVVLSVCFPEYVQELTAEQHFQSVMVTLTLAGMALYSIVLLVFREYEKERSRNAVLMKQLSDLSITDALSGLYNRRELFRRLEVMYGGPTRERTETLALSEHYIAMFDIDDFKVLNDTYGHAFGDSVLALVSKMLHNMTSANDGELAARYGGEEFMCVLKAGSTNEAYERVNEVRQRIWELRWKEHPEVCVSISGGLVSCEDHPSLTEALHDVDALLYAAKAAGKNQVCV